MSRVDGMRESRVDGIRERKDWAYFDTLLAPEYPNNVSVENTLFGSAGLQAPGGVLSMDQTFTLERVRMAAFFEAWVDDVVPYGLLQVGTIITPVVNDKAYHPVQLLHALDDRRKKHPWCVEFCCRVSPMPVPPRSLFELRVAFSPGVFALINSAKGRKFLRFFLDGELERKHG